MAAASFPPIRRGDVEEDGQELADNFSKYLILGGGIAGLGAAQHLAVRGAGSEFKLLEARKRLGGRIMTCQLGGGRPKIELGANWIHGVLGNPLYEYAVSQGLVSPLGNLPKPQNVAATMEDGRRLPFAVLQEVYEAYYWFFKRCEEYFVCKYKPPDGIVSVGAHMELEIDLYLQKFPPGNSRRARRMVFDYLLRRECCITGCHSMDEADLVGIGSYSEIPGGNVTLPNGYSSLLAPIIRSLPEGGVLKEKEVKHIFWMHRPEMEERREESGAEDSSSNDSECSVKTVKSAASSCDSSVCNTPSALRSHPNVRVELRDGRAFFADHVVCALPLGWLKRKPDLFVPRLPEEKLEAMRRVGFGTVNKIFLEYEAPFLSPLLSEVVLLWDRIPGGEGSLPLRERWFRKIYSFAKASDTLLLAWISGEEAEFMETLTMNAVADACTSLLRRFLNDPQVPKPKSCIFTAWHSQPHSLGSYTYLGIGGKPSDIETLTKPLFQKPNRRTPVVAFAGEHCHPSYYSTAHGAYLSGKNAAQFFLSVAESENPYRNPFADEEVYNLAGASVSDLSSLLQEVSVGNKSLEDYKKKGRKDKRRYR